MNEIAEHCRRDELRNCTLLLTNKKSSQAPPFKKIKIETPNALVKDLKNVCGVRARGHVSNLNITHKTQVRVLKQRLNLELVSKSVSRMPKPCRVVISGPSSFNSACREMLRDLVEDDHVTVRFVLCLSIVLINSHTHTKKYFLLNCYSDA